jgi:hypothetical protein
MQRAMLEKLPVVWVEAMCSVYHHDYYYYMQDKCIITGHSHEGIEK